MKGHHYSHHYYHRGLRKHPISPVRKFGLHVVVPLLLILVSVFLSAKFFRHSAFTPTDGLFLLQSFWWSFFRILVAYLLSMVVGVGLAALAVSSHRVESFFLPLFDILESVPILVFFPIIILFFISYKLFNLAAIFILVVNMVWNIVFNAITGFKLIPRDTLALGKVFKLGWLKRFWRISLPSIFPYLVIGSLLAWAEGWNILVVAEVLKTYVPANSGVNDLPGIGSVLVSASVSGNSKIFFGSVFLIVLAVVLINLFVWQPLLRLSEKYKFDN